METGGAISLGAVGVLAILAGVIQGIRSRLRPDWKLPHWLWLWPLVLMGFAWIFGLSLLIKDTATDNRSAAALAFYLLTYLAIGMIFLMAVLLHERDRQDDERSGLSEFWNSDKAFGGTVFGDFANTVGVIAGVGLYQVSNQAEGWFWLGQFGAFLAILVGLSLGLRAWDTAIRILAGDNNAGEPAWQSAMAVGNLTIGAGTIMALMTFPQGTTTTQSFIVTVGGIWIGFLVIVGIAGFRLAWLWKNVQATLPTDRARSVIKKILVGIFQGAIVLVPVAGIVWLAVTVSGQKYSPEIPFRISLIPFLTWGLMELATIIKLLADRNQDRWWALFARSTAILVANILMIVLVSTLDPQTNAIRENWQWALYAIALSFAGAATLAGIHLGMLTLRTRALGRANRVGRRQGGSQQRGTTRQPALGTRRSGQIRTAADRRAASSSSESSSGLEAEFESSSTLVSASTSHSGSVSASSASTVSVSNSNLEAEFESSSTNV